MATGLFLLLTGVYGLTAGGHTYSSDEEGLFETTRTLVEERDSTIRHTPDNERVVPARAGRTGEPVGVSGIGQSLVAVPLYVTGALAGTNLGGPYHDYAERVFVGWTNTFATAAGVVLLFLLACRLGAPIRWAAVLALVYGLGTFTWPHAKTFFSEPLATTFVLGSAFFAVRARQDGGRAAVVWSGLLGGSALLVRASTALFLPLVGVYVLWARVRRGAVVRETVSTGAAFAAGLVPPAVLLLLTNWWRWGSPLDLGYASVPLDFPVTEGLYGLFLSPGKSIFLYAPIVAVGLAAPFFVPRHVRGEVVWLVAMGGLNALFFARFIHWHGDHSWGPRYLVMSLPFWVLPVAPLLARVRWRRAVAVAGAVGLLSAGLGTVMYFNQYFAIAEREIGLEIAPDGPTYWHEMHFDPYWSPIAGHVRALPDVWDNSTDRLRGDAADSTAFPNTTTERYGWYFAPPQLDSWIYWIFATDGPRRLLPMAVAFTAAIGVGIWRLRPVWT